MKEHYGLHHLDVSNESFNAESTLLVYCNEGSMMYIFDRCATYW